MVSVSIGDWTSRSRMHDNQMRFDAHPSPVLDRTFRTSATIWSVFLAIMAFLFVPAAKATTYYLAPQSMGGSDSNSGTTASSPWLTPNHPTIINCGDVIQAAASNQYAYYNFNFGSWSLPNNCTTGGTAKVAWLKCATFGGCQITSGGGILVDQSFWGVQGWEVTTTLPYAACFAATPNTSTRATIHHIVFANDIANGCMGGGLESYNLGTASVDYISIVGNIAYNAAQDNTHCYSGISIYQPVASDSNSGTHIYVAGNFSFGNLDPDPCNGTAPTDGDGIIFDTFDGTQTSGLLPYTQQAGIDNNIVLGNGGRGIQIENNSYGGTNSNITVRLNTVFADDADPNQNTALCSELQIINANDVNEYSNIAVTTAAQECTNNYWYDADVYEGYSNNQVKANWLYTPTLWAYIYPTSGYGPNTTGIDPWNSNPSIPSTPECSGKSSVPNCMASVVSNLVPNNSIAVADGAKAYGYQTPTASTNSDFLFPAWMCNVGLPSGLITTYCSN